MQPASPPDGREVAVQLFRPAALTQLSSPEQLDQLLRVTTPRTWIALAAMLILTVGALLWGCFGSITTTVQGTGILVRPGGLFNVTSSGGGMVEKVFVKVGQRVEKGQVVAQVRQTAIQTEIKATEGECQHLREDYQQTAQLYAEGDRLYKEATQQLRTNIGFSIAALQRRQTALQDTLKASRQTLAKQSEQLKTTQAALAQQLQAAQSQVDRIRNLRSRGVSTQRELDTAQRDYEELQIKFRSNQTDQAKYASSALETETNAAKEGDQITESLHNFRNQLATLAKEESERFTRRKEDLFAKHHSHHIVENKLQLLKSRLEHDSKVVSQYQGYVVEVLAELGNVIQPGTPIVSLEEPTERLEVIVYIPSSRGHKVEPGMRLEITPDTVKREEYGFIVGTVALAGNFPASEDAMLRLLPNKTLVKDLAKQGPSNELSGELEQDAEAPSGYRWSSGKGPPLTIHSGTLCVCSVRVREQAPITLVIPALRKFFGIS
jgi:HlyD family secretion protein